MRTKFDVFLCYSAKDKPVVHHLADRLREDGLRVWFDDWEIRPGDSAPSKIEEGLDKSRILLFFMSENAFSEDWSTLETQTVRFRDPINKDRRFLPLRLDAAQPKGSLAQYQPLDWQNPTEPVYRLIRDICSQSNATLEQRSQIRAAGDALGVLPLDHNAKLLASAFTPSGRLALTGAADKTVRLWDVVTAQRLAVLRGHDDWVRGLAFSRDETRALSCSQDYTIRHWRLSNGECLRVLEGHTGYVWSVAFNADGRMALSASSDGTIRLWDLSTGRCAQTLDGHHPSTVFSAVFAPDGRRILTGSRDHTLRLWNVGSRNHCCVFRGHTDWVRGVAFSPDGLKGLSGSDDATMRLWDIETGRCLRVFEGHTSWVHGVAFSADGRRALSGSGDNTIRLWDLETGRCLQTLVGHKDDVRCIAFNANGRQAFSGSSDNTIRVWNIPTDDAPTSCSVTTEEIQYTNAKVLVVGDTSAGKTGLTYRLVTKKWRPSEGSTVGAWSTQWKMQDATAAEGLEREIWLWDFGGQADQRLIHQLYMDHAALILVLFDGDKEEVLPGLREWHTALRRCVSPGTPQILVAGRIDAGFRASREKLRRFAADNGVGYYETSAKEGHGCSELENAIISAIPWNKMEQRTSPRIFKLIKDEILRIRDGGQVLHTFKELREVLWHNLPLEQRFTDDKLRTVVGLLDGPGAVKELAYGTYILLQPGWINTYAQAVIRTLRQDPSELGCLPLRSIAEGKLLFQTVDRDGAIIEIQRLNSSDERIVLQEMERQLQDRGLCLRQGDKLVFPSHCGRDRPAVIEYPSIFVSYAVTGYLDDIYATLVVKLADSNAFTLRELWRDAADFDTLAGGHRMGIKLTRESTSIGEVSVYFAHDVAKQEQVIFANYIHIHLLEKCEQVQRLRHYVCPHCHRPKGNSKALMEKLVAKREKASVVCDVCDESFSLWDDLEKRFASDRLREDVDGLLAGDATRLDTRRKAKLLTLEVAARISSADQKCFEIPSSEDEGIDMEVEFTDDNGEGTGKRIYLQLKSGNSHLRKRKSDGAEIFDIKNQRWVNYWINQPHPVMLVVGTFAEEDDRFAGKDKLEFSDVRWMEIRDLLRRRSDDGRKTVSYIVFEGERLDILSVRNARARAFNGSSLALRTPSCPSRKP